MRKDRQRMHMDPGKGRKSNSNFTKDEIVTFVAEHFNCDKVGFYKGIHSSTH